MSATDDTLGDGSAPEWEWSYAYLERTAMEVDPRTEEEARQVVDAHPETWTLYKRIKGVSGSEWIRVSPHRAF